MEGAHFVKQNTERPNIGFEIVWLSFNDFRRKIVRSAHHCFRLGLSAVENSGNTEVAHFHLALLSHKDILGFDVSVQDLPVVDMLDRQADLCKPIKNLVLAPVFDFSARFLGLLDSCFHMAL